MCKVAIFTNFRKIENNKEAIEFLGNKLLKTERDGFGCSIMGSKGIYGEKFLGKNKYETVLALNKKDVDDNLLIAKYPFVEKSRQVFGVPGKSQGGALFHGRISTNKGGFKNTHPINKHGWSLIHNGVVSHNGDKYEMTTDNDTEHVLENLVKGGIDAVAANLTGYYAAGAFDPAGNLHVIKDSTAWLYVAKIPDLETLMFATTEELISEFCEEFSLERSTIEKVKDNSYMIFDSNGNMTSFKNFEPRGYGYSESRYMDKSLSYMSDNKPHLFREHYDNITEVENKELSDYESYRMEVDNAMDHTYEIYDWNYRKIPLQEFEQLDAKSQDECFIVRPDGTLVTFEDYHVDKLASDVLGNKITGAY